MNPEQTVAELKAERDRYRTALLFIAGEESGVWGVIAREVFRGDQLDGPEKRYWEADAEARFWHRRYDEQHRTLHRLEDRLAERNVAQHPEPGSLPKLPQAAFNLEKGSGR